VRVDTDLDGIFEYYACHTETSQRIDQDWLVHHRQPMTYVDDLVAVLVYEALVVVVVGEIVAVEGHD